ncbi:NAD(P)-dependent dehydrogenase (short-subunit alcohol dehydrogenase family) [Sphingopyxis sp. JAI128]|nr:NAD(P)-dependent dehydrogenase (short-subunit alcohol dehydrogenase family) [Sphingopyxis sp. JAI128]
MTVTGRSPDRVKAAVASISADTASASFDMTDEAEVEAFFATHPPFDHIVVTAAAIRSAPVRALSLDTARSTFASKFWGPYLIARFARLTDGGSLSLISGAAARRPRAGRGPVAAACAAVEALTKVLAVELAPVRVNCIAPGLVDTPMLRAAYDPNTPIPPQPVRRAALPEGIAFQILACAANPYMTGSIIDLDGGLSVM